MPTKLRLVPPPSTTPASPDFETMAWLRFKVLYRACFTTQEECAAYLKTTGRAVQRYWAGTSPIPGRVLMGMQCRARECGVVIAELQEAA